MSFEQRDNIIFCCKIGKNFTELMKQVYGDDFLFRSSMHEWFQRFQRGREDINDDQHVCQSKSVITGNSIETVREFIKNQPKSSLKFMEMELNISKTSIYRILTEHLGLRKVCARFVPHKLTDDQKLLRIQHSKDDYLTKNHILTINHSPYSPDMAPCDFFLFGKMHLLMKGKRYAVVEAIQKACAGILADVPVNELKHTFDVLLDRAKSCSEAEGDYFE
ncbi:protein GVQW3-like [Bactrocera dorsalis]|uniref:Protein GVQW3-like n=1 Tax=Bactrocera dorsalis TaxID=27457 RepID=A0ABM3J8C9_BACDO|nr:protein GVQW3-like [Bactrocera dorsalis]